MIHCAVRTRGEFGWEGGVAVPQEFPTLSLGVWHRHPLFFSIFVKTEHPFFSRDVSEGPSMIDFTVVGWFEEIPQGACALMWVWPGVHRRCGRAFQLKDAIRDCDLITGTRLLQLLVVLEGRRFRLGKALWANVRPVQYLWGHNRGRVCIRRGRDVSDVTVRDGGRLQYWSLFNPLQDFVDGRVVFFPVRRALLVQRIITQWFGLGRLGIAAGPERELVLGHRAQSCDTTYSDVWVEEISAQQVRAVMLWVVPLACGRVRNVNVLERRQVIIRVKRWKEPPHSCRRAHG
jgi:hypothetical protein